MTKQKDIDETLNNLTELIDAQQKALRTADSLLHLKDCIIEILESQKKVYLKENKILRICFYSLVALQLVSLLISLL